MADQNNTEQPKQYFTGIVKQVLDGGAVVIRGQPRNGPPPERTLALAEIDAPRMARRPTATAQATQDEPFAWEAREFLRKLLVGKNVLCTVSHTVPSGREYGHVLTGSNDPEVAENVAVKMVAEGLVKVRENSNNEAFKEAQEAAKAQNKGLWAGEPDSKHVRSVQWDQENPRALVDRLGGKPVKAVIEHVRDGSTVRAFLLPDFQHVTIMMSGVRCPMTKTGADGKPDPAACDPFAQQAHYFTESRLLQRDVEIILESVNNKNYVGSVLHPNGNIAEALLKEGFAKCVDWSMSCVTGGPEKYRAAQAAAKEKKLRVWKDYAGPTGPQVSEKDKSFSGKVIEIVNGDAVMVKRAKNDVRKIHLASIRPPRLSGDKESRPRTGGAFRPLFDIPFMFEAREFLRKKLIHQNVHVTIDYIQEANNDYPEKMCGTVNIGGVNVAEALVARGYATVVRYAADNDRRSSHYDDLLAAEDKAIKGLKGLHDTKNVPSRRIADITGDPAKSKQFMPSLQRAGRVSAVVEFVASGSRFRLYIPKETCVITFLLAGIQCPRGARTLPGGAHQPADPYGEEAYAFSKEMVLQREIQMEVEGMDKGGNFIGYMHLDNGTNLSVALVEEGLATGFMTDRSSYGRQIQAAEDNAKRRKDKLWANYVEQEPAAAEKEDEKKDDGERKTDYKKVIVTEITPEAKVYAQSVSEGPKLEQLMKEIRQEFTDNPPLAGAYQPKRNDTCAAKFVDGQWYRAKVEKVVGDKVNVLYLDYGNRATIPKTNVASLPATFNGLSPFAHEYQLAFVKMPTDEDYASQSLTGLREDLLDRTCNLNVEYRVANVPYVSLVDPEKTSEDFVKALVADGLLMVEKRGGRRLAKMVDAYLEAQEQAKKSHLNIWEYGDITGDDAKEFGIGNR